MSQSLREWGSAVAITPHATDSNSFSGVYVGGAGNITCRLAKDTADVVFTAVPVGTILNINTTFIRATGTTATNLVGLKH